MAQTGHVTVTIDDDKIKERMREFLAEAWDEGAKCRWETPPNTSVREMNPYRDPEPFPNLNQ
jgi:hypothetical protein